MTKHFTDENFNSEAIEASKDKPVLVDFFASWCGPCKMQAPIIDEVAEAMGDKAIVGKVNTEEANSVSEKYNIMSIPTLVILRDGEVKESMVGMQAKETLIDLLNRHI